jgi:hypothetical protein
LGTKVNLTRFHTNTVICIPAPIHCTIPISFQIVEVGFGLGEINQLGSITVVLQIVEDGFGAGIEMWLKPPQI